VKNEMSRARTCRQNRLGMARNRAACRVEAINDEPVDTKVGDDEKAVVGGCEDAMRMWSVLPRRVGPVTLMRRLGDGRAQLAIRLAGIDDERTVRRCVIGPAP